MSKENLWPSPDEWPEWLKCIVLWSWWGFLIWFFVNY